MNKGNPFRPALRPVVEGLTALRAKIDAELKAAQAVDRFDGAPPEKVRRAYVDAINARIKAADQLHIQSFDLALMLDIAERLSGPPEPGGAA